MCEMNRRHIVEDYYKTKMALYVTMTVTYFTVFLSLALIQPRRIAKAALQIPGNVLVVRLSSCCWELRRCGYYPHSVFV